MTLTDRLTDHRLTYLAACWPAPCNGVALGCSRLTGATYCLTDRWRWLLPSSYTVWHMVGVCSVQGPAPYITHTGDGCTLWIESLNRQGSLQRGTPSHSTLWQEHQSERHLVATRCTIHGGRLRRALFFVKHAADLGNVTASRGFPTISHGVSLFSGSVC